MGNQRSADPTDRRRVGRQVAYITSDGRPDGTLKHVIFPAVVGRKGGDASFEASDSACTVKVQYKWGNEMRGAPTAKPPTP